MSRPSLRGLVFSAMFAALTIVLGFMQIHLWFTPVPITLGNLGVMLAGAFLGPLYGFVSVFLVVVLTLIGLPVMGGSGGMGVILGPSGGYVWMWPFCAMLTGLVAKYLLRRSGFLYGILAFLQMFFGAAIFGALLCYVTGVPWLAHVAHLSLAKAFTLGALPFLPGDFSKAAVTALVAVSLRRAFPVGRLVSQGGPQVLTTPSPES